MCRHAELLIVSTRRERWAALWRRIGARGNPDEVYGELEAAYGAPGRYYHSLPHIDRLLEEFDAVRGAAHDPDAVELALWMHDVVWSPEASDAEAESAAWARERLAARGVRGDLLERMTGLILATRHERTAPASADEALVRDLDLLMFAAPAEIFDRCSNLIRQEYAHLPEPAWRAGRARVLREFLDRQPIYHSEALRGLEHLARANLGRAVATLDIPYT